MWPKSVAHMITSKPEVGRRRGTPPGAPDSAQGLSDCTQTGADLIDQRFVRPRGMHHIC
jgi:hypothetical protein